MGHCEKDTLHIFDQEEYINPEQIENLPIKERSPGSIIGKFCGKYEINQNQKYLAESSYNSLTLWWHTETNLTLKSNIQNREGFRLLWTAFRLLKSKFYNILISNRRPKGIYRHQKFEPKIFIIENIRHF